MGTTFAILSNDGKTPDERERLNKSASCLEISFFNRFNILYGILIGYYLSIGIYYFL